MDVCTEKPEVEVDTGYYLMTYPFLVSQCMAYKDDVELRPALMVLFLSAKVQTSEPGPCV
jgi:hypothetical protein